MTLKMYMISKISKFPTVFTKSLAEYIFNHFAANQPNDCLDNRWHECCKCCKQEFLDQLMLEANKYWCENTNTIIQSIN
jgi:hypothetical protein